ncbi:MAG: anti-sigma factor family protein [Phycisphaerae bacterium]
MHCEAARQLFDAYLDGELSGSLAAELGAHRLQCAACRRELALLEVSGHIIASDRESSSISDGFTDRLMACMGSEPVSWVRRIRLGLYVAAPLAAAAVVVMAFLGVFDRPANRVAGLEEQAPATARASRSAPLQDSVAPASADVQAPGGIEPLDRWLERAGENLAAKRRSSDALHRKLDLTVLQLLDILQRTEALSAPRATDGASSAAAADPSGNATADPSGDAPDALPAPTRTTDD